MIRKLTSQGCSQGKHRSRHELIIGEACAVAERAPPPPLSRRLPPSLGPSPACIASSCTSSRGTSAPSKPPNEPATAARGSCEVIRRSAGIAATCSYTPSSIRPINAQLAHDPLMAGSVLTLAGPLGVFATRRSPHRGSSGGVLGVCSPAGVGVGGDPGQRPLRRAWARNRAGAQLGSALVGRAAAMKGASTARNECACARDRSTA